MAVPYKATVFLNGLFQNSAVEPEITFDIQPDGNTLVVTTLGSLNALPFIASRTSVYKRIAEADLPPIQEVDGSTDSVLFPNRDLPIEQFKSHVDLVLSRHSAAVDAYNCEQYSGYNAAKALEHTFLTTGTTHTTDIVGVRHTTHVSGSNSYNFFSRYADLTTFIVKDYPHINDASLVEISGFTGTYAAANGVYRMPGRGAVTVRPGLGGFVDIEPGVPSNSSYQYEILIPFNSRALGDTFTGTPTITVNHLPITQDIEYVDWMDTVLEWTRETIATDTHTSQFGWAINSDYPRLYATFDQIQNPGPDILFQTFTGTEDTSPLGSFFYINPVGRLSTIRGQRVNDPYISFDLLTSADTFNYHIARNNYLQDVRVPYWRPADYGGTVNRRGQIVAGLFFSKDGSPIETLEGFSLPFDTFPAVDEGNFLDRNLPNNCELGDGITTFYCNPVEPNQPLPNGYADLDAFNKQRYQETLFYGLVDTTFTSGYTIGYIRMENFEQSVGKFLAEVDLNTDLVPDCGPNVTGCRDTTPRLGRETRIRVWQTAVMDWLVNTAQVDAIIYDIRHNNGGRVSNGPIVRESVGSGTQKSSTRTTVPKRDRNTVPINRVDADTPFVDTSFFAQQEYYFNEYSAQEYGSQFTDGPFIILTDQRAVSMGEYVVQNFLGENEDRQLGGNTNVLIMGDIDGQFSGGSVAESVLPVKHDGTNRIEFNGYPQGYCTSILESTNLAPKHPISGTYYCNRPDALKIDCGVAGGLRGKNGGCAFPNDYDNTIHVDMGYVAHPDARLPGDTRPQTPTTHFESNPYAITLGSPLVTVTTTAPHGYETGDIVHLFGADNTAFEPLLPANDYVAVIEGDREITKTGANTFTFVLGFGQVGFATIPAFGGDRVTITKRDEWRDRW